MMQFNRIVRDPKVMNGQACVSGTRLTVKRVLDIVATYKSRDEIRLDFPALQDEDIREALQYAAASMDDGEFELVSAREIPAR